MRFEPELAELRFGCGLGPMARPVADAGAMLGRLAGPDLAAEQYPIAGFASQIDDLRLDHGLTRQRQRGVPSARVAQANLRKSLRLRQVDWFKATTARYVTSTDSFRERLTLFWADHFTVVGKRSTTRPLPSTFVEDTIRPNLTGQFGEMLKAAVTHQMMLDYLDQFASFGEGSIVAERQGKGLNENLAREVLELHTLGVGGDYTQTDVREFAKLLAGFTYDRQGQVVYYPRRGSPGAEVILGKSYGDDMPKQRDVMQALTDFAIHPATARHIATKLATHFVSDTPKPGLVQHIEAAFLASGGDLMASYTAMLEHPATWAVEPVKVKQPFDFVASSFRALGVRGAGITGLKADDVLKGIVRPMVQMGQAWQNSPGPDGWPEAAEHWITPQGLAARIQWALTIPEALSQKELIELPDPRHFAQIALGAHAKDAVLFAAQAAETRWEGIGLVLASPGFQRR